jgi:hypothetical protein
VDDFWLNGFLVNDGDDSLMDVMVHMFASDGRGSILCVVDLLSARRIFEVAQMGGELLLGIVFVVMVEFSVLCRQEVVRVLLWKVFLVLDRLDRGMVVVLVNFTVNRLGCFLVAVRSDSFTGDGGIDTFFHSGMVTSVGSDLPDGCFGCVHDVGWCCYLLCLLDCSCKDRRMGC